MNEIRIISDRIRPYTWYDKNGKIFDNDILFRRIIEYGGSCFNLGCGKCPLLEWCKKNRLEYEDMLMYRVEECKKRLALMTIDEELSR